MAAPHSAWLASIASLCKARLTEYATRRDTYVGETAAGMAVRLRHLPCTAAGLALRDAWLRLMDEAQALATTVARNDEDLATTGLRLALVSMFGRSFLAAAQGDGSAIEPAAAADSVRAVLDQASAFVAGSPAVAAAGEEPCGGLVAVLDAAAAPHGAVLVLSAASAGCAGAPAIARMRFGLELVACVAPAEADTAEAQAQLVGACVAASQAGESAAIVAAGSARLAWRAPSRWAERGVGPCDEATLARVAAELDAMGAAGAAGAALAVSPRCELVARLRAAGVPRAQYGLVRSALRNPSMRVRLLCELVVLLAEEEAQRLWFAAVTEIERRWCEGGSTGALDTSDEVLHEALCEPAAALLALLLGGGQSSANVWAAELRLALALAYPGVLAPRECEVRYDLRLFTQRASLMRLLCGALGVSLRREAEARVVSLPPPVDATGVTAVHVAGSEAPVLCGDDVLLLAAVGQVVSVEARGVVRELLPVALKTPAPEPAGAVAEMPRMRPALSAASATSVPAAVRPAAGTSAAGAAAGASAASAAAGASAAGVADAGSAGTGGSVTAEAKAPSSADDALVGDSWSIIAEDDYTFSAQAIVELNHAVQGIVGAQNVFVIKPESGRVLSRFACAVEAILLHGLRQRFTLFWQAHASVWRMLAAVPAVQEASARLDAMGAKGQTKLRSWIASALVDRSLGASVELALTEEVLGRMYKDDAFLRNADDRLAFITLLCSTAGITVIGTPGLVA